MADNEEELAGCAARFQVRFGWAARFYPGTGGFDPHPMPYGGSNPVVIDPPWAVGSWYGTGLPMPTMPAGGVVYDSWSPGNLGTAQADLALVEIKMKLLQNTLTNGNCPDVPCTGFVEIEVKIKNATLDFGYNTGGTPQPPTGGNMTPGYAGGNSWSTITAGPGQNIEPLPADPNDPGWKRYKLKATVGGCNTKRGVSVLVCGANGEPFGARNIGGIERRLTITLDVECDPC